MALTLPRMYLLFIDESGQLSERRFFALGGVALRDRDWRTLRALWLETLRAHGRPTDRELKWHGVRTGAVPPKLADAIVRTIAAAPVRCYVTLLDIELGARDAPEFFASDDDVYATGLMFLAERFQLLLQDADDVGMVVVDSRFREDDLRLRRFFADLTHSGTPYMKLTRIVEGLFLGPSHYSIGLQCADLVASITAAAERGNGQARGYLKTLLPRFATHPATGAFEGVGIKCHPRARGSAARGDSPVLSQPERQDLLRLAQRTHLARGCRSRDRSSQSAPAPSIACLPGSAVAARPSQPSSSAAMYAASTSRPRRSGEALALERIPDLDHSSVQASCRLSARLRRRSRRKRE